MSNTLQCSKDVLEVTYSWTLYYLASINSSQTNVQDSADPGGVLLLL